MRAFVAVFPPPEVRNALIEAASAIPASTFRLTAPERVHLTLKFLGDVPPQDLPRISAALQPLCDEHDPFDAVTSGFGAFPSARRARILWAGTEEGTGQLSALAQSVEARLEPEGFKREDRPFVPHITLGRSRRPAPFDPTNAPELRFTVHGIDLVQSKHEATGVVYSTLRSYSF